MKARLLVALAALIAALALNGQAYADPPDPKDDDTKTSQPDASTRK